MKNLEYNVECPECDGKEYITVPFDGNNSKTYPCGECQMMGEITVNPFERFEDEIVEVDNAIADLVEEVSKDGLSKSEVNQFLDQVIKNYKANN